MELDLPFEESIATLEIAFDDFNLVEFPILSGSQSKVASRISSSPNRLQVAASLPKEPRALALFLKHGNQTVKRSFARDATHHDISNACQEAFKTQGDMYIKDKEHNHEYLLEDMHDLESGMFIRYTSENTGTRCDKPRVVLQEDSKQDFNKLIERVENLILNLEPVNLKRPKLNIPAVKLELTQMRAACKSIRETLHIYSNEHRQLIGALMDTFSQAYPVHMTNPISILKAKGDLLEQRINNFQELVRVTHNDHCRRSRAPINTHLQIANENKQIQQSILDLKDDLLRCKCSSKTHWQTLLNEISSEQKDLTRLGAFITESGQSHVEFQQNVDTVLEILDSQQSNIPEIRQIDLKVLDKTICKDVGMSAVVDQLKSAVVLERNALQAVEKYQRIRDSIIVQKSEFEIELNIKKTNLNSETAIADLERRVQMQQQINIREMVKINTI